MVTAIWVGKETAFTIESVLWKFTVMPSGLCSALVTLEKLTEFILECLDWKTCLIYLDDVIVIGRTFDEYLKNLDSANLQFSLKKYNLFQREVEHLVPNP